MRLVTVGYFENGRLFPEEHRRENENEQEFDQWPSNAKVWLNLMKDWVEWHIKSANICAASEKYIINDKEKENDETVEEVVHVSLCVFGMVLCCCQFESVLSSAEWNWDPQKKLKFYGCQPFC